VLPTDARLRTRREFTDVFRHGRRVSGRLLTATVRPGRPEEPTKVGFLVPRSCGTAVTRNRLRRRLRHLVRARLLALPAGSRCALQARPVAADAGPTELAAAVDQLLCRVTAPTDLPHGSSARE
jgi:ribonuclease P protein component